MQRKSHSARQRDLQAPQPPTYRRAPDVAAFIAERGVTLCPAGQTTKPPKKPASAKRQRPRKGPHHESWTFRRAWWRKKSGEEFLALLNRPPPT